MMTAARYGCMRAAIVGLALIGCIGATVAQTPSPEAGAVAPAPSPEAIAAARELIDLKGGNNIYDRAFIGVIVSTKNVLMQTNPMLQKDLNEAAVTLRTELAPRLDELKTEVAKYFANQMSEQELKEALAFYKSPVGTKLLKVEPQVLEQSMALGDKWAASFADEAMVKMRAEMRKRGHEL